MQDPPFRIGQFGIAVSGSHDPWRAHFERDLALGFTGVFAPDYLALLLERAARSSFVEDLVDRIGTRAIEAPQRVGKAMSLLLHSPDLLRWLEQTTGSGPLQAVAGRLVETRADFADELAWHDDQEDRTRRLAVVINLSDRPFEGGQFQLRRKGETAPFLQYDHPQPGSMLIFAVRSDLEHRVTLLSEGGPRRVYAGWFLSRPEFEMGALGGGT